MPFWSFLHFQLPTKFSINKGKMARLSLMSVIADRPIRSGVCWFQIYHKPVNLLIEGCHRPKSSLLHCHIFPVAKHFSVVMTFILGGIALLRWVEVSASLMRSTTNMILAQSSLYCFINSLSSSVWRTSLLPFRGNSKKTS